MKRYKIRYQQEGTYKKEFDTILGLLTYIKYLESKFIEIIDIESYEIK